MSALQEDPAGLVESNCMMELDTLTPLKEISVEQILNSTPDMEVHMPKDSTNDEQEQDTEMNPSQDSSLIISKQVTTVKQENMYQEDIAIKKEFDHIIGVTYPEVKQEHGECKTYPLKYVSQRGAQLLSIQSHEHHGALYLGSLRDFRPSASEITHENLKLGEEVTDPGLFLKRKQPHGDLDVYKQNLWNGFLLSTGLHDENSGPSKAFYGQVHLVKRQKVEKLFQQSDIAEEIQEGSRGASTRQLSHMLNQNFMKSSEKESNFLRIMKVSNITHNIPTEVDSNKTPKLNATSKKQMYSKMLRACPKSSDAKRNLLDIEGLQKALGFFGRKIKMVDQGWLINGMNSALLHHQAIGVAWMKQRELSDNASKGGMLCDSMGLGKTVQTIAAMVSNLPNKTERRKYQRATLVIAGTSLLAQWKAEIKKHSSERAFPRVTIYQAKKGEDLRLIASCDVVLVSYGEVTTSCPFPSKTKLSALKKENSDRHGTVDPGDDDCDLIEKWIEDAMDDCGDLHKVDWYRIVIDEAHRIKSHDLPLSYAVNALKGKHRWVLTGTPIMNRPEELYGYFRFLKEPEAKSFRMFKAKFTNVEKKPDNLERLDTILARLMIDRNMQDQFLGRPLVDLPTPHHADLLLEFSPQEEILYRAVEAKYIKVINDKLEQEEEENAESDDRAEIQTQSVGSSSPQPGDKSNKADEQSKKKPEFMLMGLNILRQMTAHPLLIERHIQEIFDASELREIHQKLLDLGDHQHLITARIGFLLQQKENGVAEYSGVEADEQTCTLCWDIAVDCHLIPGCKHNFCKICIDEYSKHTVEAGGEVEPQCPVCEQPFEVKSLRCAAPAKNSKEKSGPSASKSKSKTKPGKSSSLQPGEDSVGNLPPLIQMPWLDEFDAGRAKMPPSTKLTALEAQIRECMAAAPDDKHIVFTQWRAFAGVLGRILQRKKIRFVYLTGDMTPARRMKTIAHFAKDDSIKLMVATLKTAGEGLNLECANHVASIDPWWNCCAERQAFCRVYRIGQKKETYFARLIIANSVDQRIIEMQDKKLEMIELMMKPKASRHEMAKLFGKVVTDKLGRMRIEVDHGNTVEDVEENGSEDADSDEETDELEGQMGDSESDDDSEGEDSD